MWWTAWFLTQTDLGAMTPPSFFCYTFLTYLFPTPHPWPELCSSLGLCWLPDPQAVCKENWEQRGPFRTMEGYPEGASVLRVSRKAPPPQPRRLPPTGSPHPAPPSAHLPSSDRHTDHSVYEVWVSWIFYYLRLPDDTDRNWDRGRGNALLEEEEIDTVLSQSWLRGKRENDRVVIARRR